MAVASEVESVVGDSFPGCIPNIPGQDTNPKLPFDASIGEWMCVTDRKHLSIKINGISEWVNVAYCINCINCRVKRCFIRNRTGPH